jgi:predicted dehydrogenase
VACAAVRAGASVFIETPLSDDVSGVSELKAAAREQEVVVAVGCQLRFHPALARLAQLLDNDVLGRLIAVHVEEGEYLPGWHPYEDYRRSYAARRELGGGVVLTQIHELDYVHWLFGRPERVFAVGGRLGSLDVDVEDTASALLQHRRAGRPLPVHVHIDYLQRPPRRTCRVVGEDGTIAIDLRAPSLTWTDSSGAVVESDEFEGFQRAQMFVDELSDFLDCVRDRRQPAVGLSHAAGTLRLALADRRSIETGTLEELS